MSDHAEVWPYVSEPHDGEHCADCGRGYARMLYSVPDDIWTRLAPDVNLLCPPCLDARARAAGVTLWWEAGADEWPFVQLVAERDGLRARVEQLEAKLLPIVREVAERGELAANGCRMIRASLRAEAEAALSGLGDADA